MARSRRAQPKSTPQAKQLAQRPTLPRQPPQPQPRRGRRNRQTARAVQGLGTGSILSPLDPRPYPSGVAEGAALPLFGMYRTPVSSDTAKPVLLLIGNTGQSATVCMRLVVDPANGSVIPVPTMGSIPNINIANVSGGPTSGRSMKVGVDIVNTTGANNIGGVVYILPARSRLNLPAGPNAMTNDQWLAVASSIEAHPDTRVMAATDFVRTKHFYSWPVDDSAYHTYYPWLGTETQNTFCSHAAVWPNATTNPRGMVFYWIVIDVASAVNTFMVSARAAYYTRWPLATVPSMIQSDVPTVPQTALNATEAAAAKVGAMGAEVAANGAVKIATAVGINAGAVAAGSLAGRTARWWRDRNGFW